MTMPLTISSDYLPFLFILIVIANRINGHGMDNNIHPSVIPEITRRSNRSPFNSARIQNHVLCTIIERIGLFANTDGNIHFNNCLLQIRIEEGNLCPSTSTMRRWYIHYQQFGEIPLDTKKRIGVDRRYCTAWKSHQLCVLKEIIMFNPHFYLDEIQVSYHRRLPNDKKSRTSIWSALQKIGYRLKVYTEIALQRDEEERDLYRQALKLEIRNPLMAILIDETNKDKNTGRRRRMWALKGDKAEWKAIFAPYDEEDFSMIGAANIHGFIPQACELVFKSRGDDSHPVCGNIDGERFRDYVQHRLCRVLGDYSKHEPNSVVILDNARIHMHKDIEELINAKGAILLYTARYSPDINPIEYFFKVYKDKLKRTPSFLSWYERHLESIHCITKTTGMNTFAKCGFPNCKRVEQQHDIFHIILNT